MRAIGKRLTYANVVSTLALFLVLAGGAAYAAKVAKKSVGPSQLKANAVTTAKIKANSVTTRKIKRNAIATAKIKDRAIESEKIADGSVGAQRPQLGHDAVLARRPQGARQLDRGGHRSAEKLPAERSQLHPGGDRERQLPRARSTSPSRPNAKPPGRSPPACCWTPSTRSNSKKTTSSPTATSRTRPASAP